MSDYYISNANFKIRSRLTVSPVCLNIDYNLRQGEARLSSDFGISSNEITIEGALPTPLQMTADLICKATVITPPEHKIMIDFACIGVHWKPDHDYRIVFTEDAIREVGDRPLVSPEFTRTYTSNPLPILSSSDPAFGSTSVTNNTKIEFQFDRLMRPGRGNLYLYKQASLSNILIGTYDVNMDVEQTNTDNLTKFTINDLGLLEADETYIVTSDVKVFRDFDELYYPQLTGTTYTFTTALSTNNQFPDLISFVLSSGTLVTTYIRYRNPGAMTIDASATLTGPENWRLRRSPSSLTVTADQTVSLKYANATSRPNLSSTFDFYDIFLTYLLAGLRSSLNVQALLASIVGVIKPYIAAISSSYTLTNNFIRYRNFNITPTSNFSNTNIVEYGVLQNARGVETYSTNTTTNITNGPIIEAKTTNTRTGDGTGFYTISVTPSDLNAVGSLSSTTSAYTWTLNTFSLTTTYPNPSTLFGNKLMVSGDGKTLVVGDYFANETGTGIRYQGYIAIFIQSGSSWVEQTYIDNPYPDREDNFGYDVAISNDGNTIAVGSINDEISTTDSGVVYIYTRSGTTWTLQTRLEANDAEAYNNFGSAVNLSDDGNMLAVGSPQASYSGNTGGKVYIYTRSGSTWSRQTTISNPNVESLNYFGNDVALNSNGTYLIIGDRYRDFDSNQNSSGVVYIYTRSGTTWTQQTQISATKPTPYTPAQGDQFGYSVDINDDGTVIAVGCPYDDFDGTNAGGCFIFRRSGTTWTQEFRSTDITTGTANANRGWDISISGDGNIVGLATNYSSGFIFQRIGTTWSNRQSIIGSSISISKEARVIVTANNSIDTDPIRVYNGSWGIYYSSTKTLELFGTKSQVNALVDTIQYTPATGYTGNFNLVYTGTVPDGRSTTRTQAVTRV